MNLDKLVYGLDDIKGELVNFDELSLLYANFKLKNMCDTLFDFTN